MLESTPLERPVSFQLFGADVNMMAKAADILNEFKPDIVDINMGCPVKKVTKKGAGAALMAHPKLAESIIKQVVEKSEAPVTVKFRTGVDSANISCIDFANIAENCGASAVTVHGRTWAQGFKGSADWRKIADVKKNVSIPVIGNGDISSNKHALDKINAGYCDGVMIGRGALGNPWAFHSSGRPDDPVKIVAGAIRHLQLMEDYIDVNRLLAVIKNHIGRYFKEHKGSSSVRKNIYSCTSYSALRTYLDNILESTELL